MILSKLFGWLRGKAELNGSAKIIELAVAEHYWQQTGEPVFIPVGRFHSFDGVTRSRGLSFECKFEAMAKRTGNLCFEHSYKGKPSGVVVTDAGLWVHCYPVDKTRLQCLEFEIDELRDRLSGLPLMTGGDWNKSRFKLLPISEAEKIAKKRFEICINWNDFQPYWQ